MNRFSNTQSVTAAGSGERPAYYLSDCLALLILYPDPWLGVNVCSVFSPVSWTVELSEGWSQSRLNSISRNLIFTYYNVAFFSLCVCRWGPCVCRSWVRWAGSFISRKSPVCPSTTPSWPPVPNTASVMLDTGPLTPWALRKVCFSVITNTLIGFTINILLTWASKQMPSNHPKHNHLHFLLKI